MPTTSSVKIERHSERECGLLEILYKMAVYRRETYMLFAYLSGQEFYRRHNTQESAAEGLHLSLI